MLDALEKQAERDKDFATVAEVLERRVELRRTTPARLASLQKLGAVYAERLKDPAAAARTWRRVLALSPGHAQGAPRPPRGVLRRRATTTGSRSSTPRRTTGRASSTSSPAPRTRRTEPAVKLDLSFRAAAIFEEQLKAPERALRSYERVLSVSPSDARAAAALVPIYEKEEKWARLPALYEVLLDATDDAEAQVGDLRKLAAVTGGPLADKPSGARLRAPRLRARAGRGRARSARGVVARGGRRGRRSSRPSRAGSRRREEPRRRDEQRDAAAEARRGLRARARQARRGGASRTATSSRTIRPTTRRAGARRAPPRERAAGRSALAVRARGRARSRARTAPTILEEWATLEEEVFGDPAKAIVLLRKVVELDAARINALRALSRLLIAAGEFEAAAEVVAHAPRRQRGRGARAARGRARDALPGPARAAGGRVRGGGARAASGGARPRRDRRLLAACRAPGDARARGQGARRRVRRDGRRTARGAWRSGCILEAERDPARRRRALPHARDVEEKKLARGRARRSTRSSARCTSSRRPRALGPRRRAVAARRPPDRPRGGVPRAPRRGPHRGRQGARQPVEVELCERAASLHDEQLGDPEGAMPYLERVLAPRPEQPPRVRAAEADPDGGRALGRARGALRPRREGHDGPERAHRAAHEVALIAEEIIGDAAKAIGYYERILELDPFYTAALDSLEKLYEREGRWRDLAALLEQRLKTATEAESVEHQAVARQHLPRPAARARRVARAPRGRAADPPERRRGARARRAAARHRGAPAPRGARARGGVRGARRDPAARAGPRDPARGRRRPSRSGASCSAASACSRTSGSGTTRARSPACRELLPLEPEDARGARAARRDRPAPRRARAGRRRCSRRPRTRAGRPPSAAKS